MKNILVIGAGRSSSSLIRYLGKHSHKEQWNITVTDRALHLAQERIEGLENCVAVSFNALDATQREEAISKSDIVISMLPARFHIEVVKDCIRLKKDIITPSYVTKEILALDQEAKDAGIIILNEMGLDPGIDHMSAMKILDDIRNKGGKMSLFKSFTGGLVAPESDNNPWNYKFTWNPRNVVLAGQGGAAEFIRNGKYKYIPYHNLFRRVETIKIEGFTDFEGYANRDSLKYRKVYGLEDIETIYRGTLRKKGFSKAWDCFVQLGMTDDTYQLQDLEVMTYRDFTNTYLPYSIEKSVEDKLCKKLSISKDGTVFQKLKWLGIFDSTKVDMDSATPAQLLQKIMEQKLSLDNADKDLVAMWHQFVYELDGQKHRLESHMTVIGDDPIYTAMAKTVGLPIGIAVKMLTQGTLSLKGVHLPTLKEIYEPILKELEQYGIVFIEKKM
ncbi:MAG: saccharopine dehydrogenase C-terminal domain-containing protein [Saprospiraceae bacterium]